MALRRGGRLGSRLRFGAAIAAGIVVVGVPLGEASSHALPRSTVDRPDDVGGAQVHAIYVLPSDGEDRQFDSSGAIETSVNAWQVWLRGQTGGRGLRLDTFQGQLDVTFFRLSESDAQMKTRGAYVRDAIEAELRRAGRLAPGKIYAAYYDGGSTWSCGGGAFPPALPGSVGAMYLRGTPPNSPPCAGTPFPQSPPGYFEFGMLHELLHTLGYAPTCAPHAWRFGHVSDSNEDLMWSGDPPLYWQPKTLDVGRDDYFDANVPGCPDLADSAYLEGSGVDVSVSVVARGGDGIVEMPASRTSGAIECTASCRATYEPSASVVLRAMPSHGSAFERWGGDCAGTDAECTLVASEPRSVTATFVRATARISIAVTGKGRVVSTPRRMACPSRCSALFPVGQQVTLRATPAKGWTFSRWSKLCGKKPRCTFEVGVGRSLRAVFRRA